MEVWGHLSSEKISLRLHYSLNHYYFFCFQADSSLGLLFPISILSFNSPFLHCSVCVTIWMLSYIFSFSQTCCHFAKLPQVLKRCDIRCGHDYFSPSSPQTWSYHPLQFVPVKIVIPQSVSQLSMPCSAPWPVDRKPILKPFHIENKFNVLLQFIMYAIVP